MLGHRLQVAGGQAQVLGNLVGGGIQPHPVVSQHLFASGVATELGLSTGQLSTWRLKHLAAGSAEAPAQRKAIERSFGWLVHWGGLLRDRAGRLDVSAGRLAFVAILSGVQALLRRALAHGFQLSRDLLQRQVE